MSRGGESSQEWDVGSVRVWEGDTLSCFIHQSND